MGASGERVNITWENFGNELVALMHDPQLRQAAFPDVRRRFTNLERRVVRRFHDDLETQLAARKQVKEQLMLWHFYREQPLAACRRAFRAIERLGFYDLAREVHVTKLYCSYCVKRGWMEEALAKALPLHASVVAAHGRSKRRQNRFLLQAMKELVDKLAASGSQRGTEPR